MKVDLFKKVGTYVDNDGNEKTATNFYIDCNGFLVPVEVKYFAGEDGLDKRYSSRKSVLTSFADFLPEKK